METGSPVKRWSHLHKILYRLVEFSDDKAQLPLNTLHTAIDFGANAYLVDEQFPYGYLTLTDHFANTIPPAYTHEHIKGHLEKLEIFNESPTCL
ncbi:T3SS effector OspC family protein [Sodalis endosymbiont of Spalangia cameroni]|uniref:T3SS effector OspC family protein n=1 Tax=Sodalis praecaptivus TaxID=1239307 RepID=UPI0031F97803